MQQKGDVWVLTQHPNDDDDDDGDDGNDDDTNTTVFYVSYGEHN